MKKSIILALLIVVVVVGWLLSGVWWSSDQYSVNQDTGSGVSASAELTEPALPRVRVRSVEAKRVPLEIILLGTTEAKRKVRLRAQTAGVVKEVLADKGQVVRQGDVLIKLAADDRLARLRQAKALLELRQTEFDAAASLSKKNLRSQIALSEARALLTAAMASLEGIKVDIDRTRIRAPFDGVVDQRFVELGDYMKVGEPVATILDLSTIVVAGDVSEHNVSKIKPGLSGHAVLVDKRELDGKITYVARSSNASTRTFRVELEVPNPDYSVAEGITAKITLLVGETVAHRLSLAVLTLSDEGVMGIKVVNADNVVEFLPVTLVADTPEGTWLGGLPKKLELISVGHEFVKKGQKVIAVPEQKAQD